MEYIYLLQRESDENYDSFKVGMTTDINHRLRASDYRRATIYLVRAVPKSTARNIEQSILTSFKLRFTQTKNQFKGFGKEDFIFENDDLFKAIDLINNVCNETLKIDYENKSESIIYSINNDTNYEYDNKYNNSNSDDSLNSNNEFESYKHQVKQNLNIDLNNKINDISDDKDDKNYKNENINDECEILNETNDENMKFNNYNSPKKIKHNITFNPTLFTIKIEIDDFRKIFDSIGMLYIVKDINLFKIYFNGIIDLNNTLKYRIDYINKFVDIKFDRLYLKRSPRLSTQPIIKSPYLTQIIKIDNILLVGINQSDIYNPLTIRFYVPNNAFEKEIQNWELLGVLENPILLKCFKSHGFNCYAIN